MDRSFEASDGEGWQKATEEVTLLYINAIKNFFPSLVGASHDYSFPVAPALNAVFLCCPKRRPANQERCSDKWKGKMTVKWATFVFRSFVEPAIRQHHNYYMKKVAVDRYLEQRGLPFIIVASASFGTALFLVVVPYRPNATNTTLSEGTTNIWEVMRASNIDDFKVLPSVAFFALQENLYSRILAVNDMVDARNNRDEVAALKLKLQQGTPKEGAA